MEGNDNKDAQLCREDFAGCIKTRLFNWKDYSVPALGMRVAGQDVWLLAIGKNLGYAKANNIGACFAKDMFNVDFLIFSNNDIRFPELLNWGVFENIFQERRNIFLVGPKVTGVDGVSQNPHKKISVWRMLFLQYWNALTHGALRRWCSDLVNCTTNLPDEIERIFLESTYYYKEYRSTKSWIIFMAWLNLHECRIVRHSCRPFWHLVKRMVMKKPQEVKYMEEYYDDVYSGGASVLTAA